MAYFDVSEDIDTSYLENKIKKTQEEEKKEHDKTEEKVKLRQKKIVSELKSRKKA